MLRLKSTQTLRPFAHYLSDKIANNLVEVVKKNNTLFSGLMDIRVETLLVNSDTMGEFYVGFFIINTCSIEISLVLAKLGKLLFSMYKKCIFNTDNCSIT